MCVCVGGGGGGGGWLKHDNRMLMANNAFQASSGCDWARSLDEANLWSTVPVILTWPNLTFTHFLSIAVRGVLRTEIRALEFERKWLQLRGVWEQSFFCSIEAIL
jgi:hypothetical protein